MICSPVASGKMNITNVLFLTEPANRNPSATADLLSSALANSPNILLMQASHGRNTLAIAYWKNLTRPELNLDLNLGTDGQDSRFAPSFGPSQFSFSLGIRLALPWGSAAPDNLRNAELEKKVLDLRLASLQRDIANNIRAAVRNINNAASRISAATRPARWPGNAWI
jgi:outer membrane protein TolC